MKKSKPIVSILVITYNHAGHIEDCLNSLINQKTDFDFEIVVGEDGSSDGTKEKLIELRDRFPNLIKLFFHDRSDVIYVNGFATGRGNYLATLRECQGKFIAYIEGDDIWVDDEKLQVQYDFLNENPDYALVGHWVKNIDQHGHIINMKRTIGSSCPEVFTANDCYDGALLHPNTWFWRSEYIPSVLNSNMLKKLPAGDDPLMFILLQHGKGFCIKKVMSCHRIHVGGTWTTRSATLKRFFMMQFVYSLPKISDEIQYHLWFNSLARAHIKFIVTVGSAICKGKLEEISEFGRVLTKQRIVTPIKFFLLFLLSIVFFPINIYRFARSTRRDSDVRRSI